MNVPASARLTYRLWRTSALLCLAGAAELAVLAWQRHAPWIAVLAVPLLAVTAYATRRAARIRRSWDA